MEKQHVSMVSSEAAKVIQHFTLSPTAFAAIFVSASLCMLVVARSKPLWLNMWRTAPIRNYRNHHVIAWRYDKKIKIIDDIDGALSSD